MEEAEPGLSRRRQFDYRISPPTLNHRGLRQRLGQLLESFVAYDPLEVAELRKMFEDLLAENRRLYTKLTKSMEDYLTGLGLRRYLFERGAALFQVAQIKRLPLTFIYVDVDNMKLFNDKDSTHKIGDQLLHSLAAFLRAVFRRRADILARWGGDEFVVLTLGERDERLERMSTQFVSWLAEKKIVIGSGMLPVHFSVGGVTLYLDGSKECSYSVFHLNEDGFETQGSGKLLVCELEKWGLFEELVKEVINIADRAMYLSKKTKSERRERVAA